MNRRLRRQPWARAAMFEATRGRAGRSCCPAMRPLRSMKFIVMRPREDADEHKGDYGDTHRRRPPLGMQVGAVKTLGENFSPGARPTAARKASMPIL